MERTIAVLTGDVVESTALPADKLDALFAALERAVEAMRVWPDAPDILTWSRFRGDGWQLVVGRAELALRACLFLRAAIRSAGADFETRIGVGLGAADAIDMAHPGAASGPAFERSGRCLDGLAKHFRFGIDAGGEARAERLLAAVFAMADALSGDWTMRQAEVMSQLLAPNAPNQQAVGERLSPAIGQTAVSDHFIVARGPALLAAVTAFEGNTSYLADK